MTIDAYDYVTVSGDWVTVDALVWRRYRMAAFGIVERLLDDNPHLAKFHATSPFIPHGTQVKIPIDTAMLRGAPQPEKIVYVTARPPR